MSQTVRYDAAALQRTMEERAGQYETFKGQLMVLKEKMMAVTNLDEAFEGKAADSIKSFFKAQSTIVEMWIQLVDQQILFMNDVGAMAEDRQLGGSTFVDVPFLEEELETAHVRTMEMIQKQHKDLVGVLAKVNDLVAIESYSTAEMGALLEDAKNKRNDTIETLEEYDHALASEYEQSVESQELVDSLLDSLVQSTSQNGTITTVSFNAHAFENSEAFTSIEGARGRSLAYINQKQEQQEVREANARAATLDFSEMNGLQTANSGANYGVVTPTFMASNHGPLFNMMNPNRLDQMISAAYLPVTTSTPKTNAEKQLEDLQAQKGILNEPITEEEFAGLREYLSDPETIESFGASNPGDAVEGDYMDPTFADMRKVLGNPNSDVGMEAGGHYVVGGMKFLFEDVIALLHPESSGSERALAAGFIFVRPAKVVEKALELRKAKKLDIKTKIPTETEAKILEGQRVGTSNRIKGGHSPNLNDGNINYAVEVLDVNKDGTKVIKYTTQFSDGNLSKIKKSTIFPEAWSDDRIIDAIKTAGDSPVIGTRLSDGATLHRITIDGVQIEVIKVGETVTSGYPTGGGSNGLLPGFN